MFNFNVIKVANLLKRANSNQVIVVREGDNLKLQFRKGRDIDPRLVQEIKDSKADILDYLKDAQSLRVSRGLSSTGISLSSLPAKGAGNYDAMHQQEKEFLRFLITGRNSSNLRVTLRFQSLDRIALEKAISSLFQRHESLRTTFLQIDGLVKQVVHEYKTGEFRIEYVSLKGENDGEKVAGIHRNINSISFDMEKGPLIDLKVIDLPEDASIMVLTIHHAISDATSLEILKREIGILYDACRQGDDSPLPELPLQYKDYGGWINSLLASPEGKEGKAAYVERIKESLSKDEEALADTVFVKQSYREELEREMKMILKTEDISGFADGYGMIVALTPRRGASYTIFITGSLSGKLKSLSTDCNSSLFMTLIAAFAIVFYKKDRKKNIRISVPFSTRIFEQFENIVGWLTHNLILCIDVNDQMNVGEFIRAVTDNAWEASDSCFYPHEMIMKDLDVPLNVLAPVYINLLKTEDQRINDFTPVHSDKGSGILDLKCIVNECENGIAVRMNYNADKYSRDEIESISGDYLTILENMAEDPKSGLTVL